MGEGAADTHWQEELTGKNVRSYTDYPDDDGGNLRQRRHGVAWSTSSDGGECSVRTGSTQPEDNNFQDCFLDLESWNDAHNVDESWSVTNMPRTSSSVDSIQSNNQGTHPEQEQDRLFPGENSPQLSLTPRLNRGFTQNKETMSENIYVPFNLSEEPNHVLANRELPNSEELLQCPTNGTGLNLESPQTFSGPTLVPRKMSLPSLKSPPLPLKPSKISSDYELPTKAQSNQQLSLLATYHQEETQQLQSEKTEEGTPPLLPPKPKSSQLTPVTKIKDNHADLPPPRPPKPKQDNQQIVSPKPKESSQQPLLPLRPSIRNERHKSPERRNQHQNNQASGNGHQTYPKLTHDRQPNPTSRNNPQQNPAPRNYQQNDRTPRNGQQQIPAPRNNHQHNLAPRIDHQQNRAPRNYHQRKKTSVKNEQQNSQFQIIPLIVPRILTVKQSPIVQSYPETQVSCSVSQHRYQATPTPSTSSEEVAQPSSSNAVQSPTPHNPIPTQRLKERRPHFLLNKRNLLIASSTSVVMSLAAISFLVCTQLNIFSYTWRDLTFKEGAYKTCVKCLSLYLDLSQDLWDPEIQNLITEPRNGENFCCAVNSQQLSLLLKLMLRQQQYKPSASELTKPSVVPSAHVCIVSSSVTSNIIGDGHTLMQVNLHQTDYQHNKSVRVEKYGLIIQTSGYYYVYSSIFYDVNHSQCRTNKLKRLEHTIFLVSPTNRDDSGILAKTAYTCCADCLCGDKQSSFAGGVFKLLENDQLATSVTNMDAVAKFGNSYLGVVMLGT